MVLALSAIAHTAIRKLSQSSVLQLFAERTRRIYEPPRQLAFASPLRFVAVSAAVPRSAAALPRPPWYKASAQVQALWGCVTRASVSALSRRRASLSRVAKSRLPPRNHGTQRRPAHRPQPTPAADPTAHRCALPSCTAVRPVVVCVVEQSGVRAGGVRPAGRQERAGGRQERYVPRHWMSRVQAAHPDHAHAHAHTHDAAAARTYTTQGGWVGGWVGFAVGDRALASSATSPNATSVNKRTALTTRSRGPPHAAKPHRHPDHAHAHTHDAAATCTHTAQGGGRCAGAPACGAAFSRAAVPPSFAFVLVRRYGRASEGRRGDAGDAGNAAGRGASVDGRLMRLPRA